MRPAIWGTVGAVVALGAVLGAAALRMSGPTEPTLAHHPVVADDAPDADTPTATPPPTNRRECPLDVDGIVLEARPDPGLGRADVMPFVPLYRSYVPARLSVLVCPATPACGLPGRLKTQLWTAQGAGAWTRSPLLPKPTRRGTCVELAWEEKAEAVWPDAEEGVVRWGFVLGVDVDPAEARALRAPVWEGDVVYAGERGSPRVE